MRRQDRREKFSIRKTTLGAVSARIAVVGLLALLGAGYEVKADGLPSPEAGVADAGFQEQENVIETIDLSSPTTYVADETQDVGYHEVTQEGETGQLIIKETDEGQLVAERIEATPTVEVLGTKPKVVSETITEKAETEYVANDSLEAGQQVVKQEGIDGKEIVKETYRILAKDAETVNDTTVGQTPYTIDSSQTLPSDQVVIDEQAIRDEIEALSDAEKWQVFQESSKRLARKINQYESQDLASNLEAFRNSQLLTTGDYADIKADYLRLKIAYEYRDRIKLYQRIISLDPEEPVDLFYKGAIPLYPVGGSSGSFYLREDVTGDESYYHQLVDGYGLSSVSSVRDYLKYLEEQGVNYSVVSDEQLNIDGKLYWIESDLTTAYNTTNRVHPVITYYGGVEGFETLTELYNNSRGYADSLPITYETESMPEEDKAWFEEQLASLPRAIQRQIEKLVIQDEIQNNSNNLTAQGIARYHTNIIQLAYSNLASKEDLLRVFFHELSHTLDNKAEHISLSQEFLDFYHSAVNRAITEENPTVRDYYQRYIHESFAEFFGEYLLKRQFGYDYTKFIKLDGDDAVLTLRPYDHTTMKGDGSEADLEQAEQVAKNRENYEKYYNDPRAYSPIEEFEWFFDKLYALLFEQAVATEAEVVVDGTATEVITVQHKIIEVGTKPTVVREVTQYTTLEVADNNLYIGERVIKQVGQDGIVETTTTYELVDKTTGQLVATTNKQVLQTLVQEIIVVGTKTRSVVTTIYRQTPSGVEEIEVAEEDGQKSEKVTKTYLNTRQTSPVAYATIRQDDSGLEKGKEVVQQVGQLGLKVTGVTYTVVDGQLVMTLIDELTPAVDEIILVGRQEPVADDEEDRQDVPEDTTETESLPEEDSNSEDVRDKAKPKHQTIKAVNPTPTYSRVTRAVTEKALPNTGDALSVLGLLGGLVSTIGFVGLKRRR